MNNARLVVEAATLRQEVPVDLQERLRQREGELMRLIEVVKEVAMSEQWSSLKKLYLDGITTSLKKELLAEASKDSPDLLKLSKINGQVLWARRYSDLSKLETEFRTELARIKQTLHGTETPGTE